MRAIINCTFSPPEDAIVYDYTKPQEWISYWKRALGEMLAKHNWFISLPQSDPALMEQKQNILNTVHGDHKKLIEATFLFTIYDSFTDSYGIINAPTSTVVEVRIKNRDSVLLKRACEKLVNDLQRVYLPKRGSLFRKFVNTEPTIIKFDEITVLEAQSDSEAFSGEVLPLKRFPRRFRLAFKERASEAILGAITLILAIIMLVISVSATDQLWKGFLERGSTAFVVTGFVSFLQILLHWFAIRRQSIIKWSV